jgi:hypothetical protein
MGEVERRLEQPSRGRSSASCARDTRTSMYFATQEQLPSVL